ncbi:MULTISPECIES: hypothetical protein [Paraburkholderia]|uniref:Uncharacterized protein n=1 Tax=Paraburkholderia megapolitana TaxID=420953 RepID=A0A1I3SKS6_9BURK|nr:MULTISPECIES: hypothetical protein [Paraburkholderia]MCX4166159.1 hypothetical protein [Paraburkholderia megapolitana]MDN7161649.1 hypothetical protein [Paraburkholderia sp. CHISQ3]MDQ6498697.1 hypothetical protein [Paraburkholderia megapolitana]QDQ85654.1 hypothetical protein FNZ07_32215 [Paraburkholderia megapolitana]SFJ59374.1 hypothetical protein SAMN05192543_108269 [Paraburkholderia megapolitana]
MKTSSEHSLRFLVEKWLSPGPSAPIHVIEFSRTRWDHRRYVCVEAVHASGSRALFFFRHDDGCWCVFPPTPDKLRHAEEMLALDDA